MESKDILRIAICTRGRSKRTFNEKTGKWNGAAMNVNKLYSYAEEHGFDKLNNCYLFIEPREVEDYVASYPNWPKDNIIVLGGNNMGLAFTRQTALQFFQDKIPTEWVVMLDDDALLCEYYYGHHEKKGIDKWMFKEVPLLEGLPKCHEYLLQLPEQEKVGMAAMEYNHYSWTKEKDFPMDGSFISEKVSNWGSNNSYCDCIVFWRPLLYKEKGIKYDNYPLKADRDFTMQVAFAGLYTRKIYRFVMDSPLNGKAAGGCQDWYKKENQERDECLELIDKWNIAYPNAELLTIKEKKTSYGRSTDLKFWWNRAFYARHKGIITTEVTHRRPIDESVNYYETYTSYLEKDA